MRLPLNCSDGRETMQVMKQVERSSSPNLNDIVSGALCITSENQLWESAHIMALPTGSLN